MALQYKLGDRYSNSRKEVMIHETEELELEARFTWDLIKQLGIVACDVNGEDSSGRQKARLLTPEEVVDRAMNISSYAFQKFREKGLVVNLPDIKEVWPSVEDEA